MQVWKYCPVLLCKHLIFRHALQEAMACNLLKLLICTVLQGLPNAEPSDLQPWQRCAYQFRLRVYSRTTDGYYYISWKEFNDHYFLDIGVSNLCKGDFDNDGVIDGSDLADFAEDFGRTDCLPLE